MTLGEETIKAREEPRGRLLGKAGEASGGAGTRDARWSRAEKSGGGARRSHLRNTCQALGRGQGVREGRRDGFHRDCSEFGTTDQMQGISCEPGAGPRGKWEEGSEGGEGAEVNLLGWDHLVTPPPRSGRGDGASCLQLIQNVQRFFSRDQLMLLSKEIPK